MIIGQSNLQHRLNTHTPLQAILQAKNKMTQTPKGIRTK